MTPAGAPRRGGGVGVQVEAQRGSAGLLTVLAGGLVACLGFVAVAAATDAGLAAAKARTAADAAALAAVSASPLVGGDGDPRAAARALAEANDAEVVSCCAPQETADGAERPVVRVRVVVAARPRLRLLRAATDGLRSAATAVARPATGRPGSIPEGPDDPRAAGGGGPPGHGGEALAGPFERPVAGPVTSGFGWRIHPITGVPRPHTGTDFAATRGTPVGAAAGGVVTSAGPRGGYGQTVVVDHDNHTATLYAHLSSIAVSSGQPVRRGELLGLVGSTGQSTGPHLHFEVRVSDAPVDPLPRLP